MAGGDARALCDAPIGRGGTWGENGQIIFAPGFTGPLQRVSEAGGAPSSVTSPDSAGELHRFPSNLPGGKKILFSLSRNAAKQTGIYVADLAADGHAGTPRLLVPTISVVGFAPSRTGGAGGHLLWFDDQDRGLRARPFRVSDAAFTGDVTPVVAAVNVALSGGRDAIQLLTGAIEHSMFGPVTIG